MPDTRYGHGVAVLPDGHIIVVGGRVTDVVTGTRVDSRVDLYDPVANTWTMAANLPTPRAYLAVVAGNDGRVYAIGGSAGGSNSNVVEIYDPATNTWSTGAPAPTARTNVAAAVLPDGRIVVVGGGNCGSGYNRQVEAYVPSPGGPGAWGTLAMMTSGLASAAVAVGGDGRLYVFGGNVGCYASSAIYALDVGSNTWSLSTTRLPTTVFAAAAGRASDGSIYGVGGFTTTFDSFGSSTFPAVRTTWRSDPTTGTIQTLAPLPTARGFYGAVVHPNGLTYVPGGATYYTISNPQFPTSVLEAYSIALDLWRR